MDIKSSACFSPNEATPAEQTVSDAFHFEFPSWTSITEEDDGAQSAEIIHGLPSSLRILCNLTSSSARPCCSGECVVTYKIRAIAISRGVIIAEATRTIDIVPTLEPRPPVWTEDFVGDYVKYNIVNLRSSVLQRRLGTLSLLTTEPSPLAFSQGERFASSNVALRLFYQQRISRVGCNPPPTTQARVRMKLEAVTIVSVVTQKKQPTEHEANISPFRKRMVEDCGREAIWTLLFSPWRPQRHLLSQSGKDPRSPEKIYLIEMS